MAELKLAVSESRAGPSDSSAQVLDDAVWALVNLGYKRAEAEVGGRFPRRLCRLGVGTIIRRSLMVLFGEK